MNDEETARMRADLAEATAALLDLSKRCLTVKTSLDKPYSDDPRWSPWTRYVEAPTRAAYNLGCRLRREYPA